MLLDDDLRRMQRMSARVLGRTTRPHPGQLAWSARYGDAEALGHGPVVFSGPEGRDGHDVGWAWAEAPDWWELCLDPATPDPVDVVADLLARLGAALDDALDDALDGAAAVTTSVLASETALLAGLAAAGFAEQADAPWFTHHHLDLDLPPAPVPESVRELGVELRPVRRDEASARAACHRRAWSPPGSTSRVTTSAYTALMATEPYDPALDLVAVGPDGELLASGLGWLATTGAGARVVLIEPVGCVPEARGQKLAGAAILATLHAARALGATEALVCPRGDPAYPGPTRLYRRLGFTPGERTRTLHRSAVG